VKSLAENLSLQLVKKIITLGAFLLIWQLVVSQNLMTPLMFGNLPSPLQVLTAIKEALQNREFYLHILTSLERVGTGVAIATVLGVPLGLMISLSRLGRDFLFPLLEIFRPIPQIAWIPMAILLFPTVEQSIIYITFIGAFFPILINTISGVRSIPPVLMTAANCLGATRRQLVVKVVLPGALPGIFTGFTIGVGVSWMGVIAAEMISGKYGLGYFTWISYTLMNYPDTVVGMIAIGGLGSLCFGLIRLLEKRLIRWHY